MARDSDRIAERFDRSLPVKRPVTDRLAAHLGHLNPGTDLLDLACGTGEPGQTLLQRNPGTRLRGIDHASTVTTIAAKKAAAKGLPEARYDVMDTQALAIGDGSVDVAVSRFGLLSFVPDPRIEAGELARVLRPGGAFAIAAWDAASKNTVSFALTTGLRPWLRPQIAASLERQERFAMPGRRESWLAGAGITEVRSELFAWSIGFANGSRLWEFAYDAALVRSIAGDLDDGQRDRVRETVFELVADYRRPDGSYRLPYACRVVWGVR